MRGWQLKYLDRCKARLAQISDWDLEEGFYLTQAEADQHEGGKVAEPILSYRSFIRFWKKHFPKLVIRKRGEDTCDQCHERMLKIQHLLTKKLEAEKKIEEAGDDDNEGTTVEELQQFVRDLQEEIDLVEKHIIMADTQREKYKYFEKVAKEDIEKNTVWNLRTIFLVIDMAQNGYLPMLLGEQMGSIYYMSELIHLIFGTLIVVCYSSQFDCCVLTMLLCLLFPSHDRCC